MTIPAPPSTSIECRVKVLGTAVYGIPANASVAVMAVIETDFVIVSEEKCVLPLSPPLTTV